MARLCGVTAAVVALGMASPWRTARDRCFNRHSPAMRRHAWIIATPERARVTTGAPQLPRSSRVSVISSPLG